MYFDNFYKSFDELSRMILSGDSAVKPFNGLRPSPRLNMYETDEGYTVEAALPGVNPESIDLSIEDDVLTLSGERPAPTVDRSKYSWAEVSHGTFSRRIRLAKHVDRNDIKAEYENGMLTVTLPKAEAVRPKKVAIKVK